jgi:hypothetical protein
MRSLKTNVIQGRTIVADLDEANIDKLVITPTIIVKTSKGHHQAYWVMETESSVHEQLSKNLTYSIPKCDPSGWCLGHRFRLPSTLNYKYDPAQKVEIVFESNKHYKEDMFALIPEVVAANEIDLDWLKSPIILPNTGPLELLETVRSAIPIRVYLGYKVVADDRSVALWALMCSLFRAGLSREQVYLLAYNSPNNKFSGQRYNGDRDLAKDVLRAEQSVQDKQSTIRDQMEALRHIGGIASDRKQLMANLAVSDMSTHGRFIHTTDEDLWYVVHAQGRPIAVNRSSGYLDTLLTVNYGLNSSEMEARYVVSALDAHTRSVPANVERGVLSHYRSSDNTILLHCGASNILRISGSNVERIPNGSIDIMFPWVANADPFMPVAGLGAHWSDVLFDGALDTVVDTERKNAKALLTCWFVFLLLRNAVTTKPILALFGQPGCLSTETIVELRRGKQSFNSITLAKAYYGFNKSWDKSIPTRLRSLKDGIIQWRNVKRIIASGRKLTYTITIENKIPFRATADHRFLTPNGYKQLSELKAGDSVVIKEGTISHLAKPEYYRRRVTARYHPYATEEMVGIYGPYYYIRYYRAVLDAALNNLTVKQFLFIVNHDIKTAATLQYTNKDAHIYHKDGNSENDTKENLKAMSKLEHDTLHGKANLVNLGAYSGLYATSTTKVVSIIEYGLEHTYDIEMEDTNAPNFLINDVIVHNSGKSTLFKRIYRLLYGATKSLNSVSTPDDFDHAVSQEPLVVLDNVDTWEKWLPDRLALSAASSEMVRRKLYTDSDTITLKRQALLGITAHNPKFGREDVVDRLLILMFERLPYFKPEGEILDGISKLRPQLWGSIVTDLQLVLQQPWPQDSDIPQFRIEDFSRLGYRIAKALHIEDDFCASLTKVRNDQRQFNLGEDDILVNALSAMLAYSKYIPQFEPSAILWSRLQNLSTDTRTFERMYKNSNFLGKKLWAMQDTLLAMFNVDYETDRNGVRKWRFMKQNA